MKKLLAVIMLLCVVYIKADMIAKYKLDGGTKGIAEPWNIVDTADDKSNAIKRINWPFWTTSVLYKNKKIKVPASGKAVGMTLSGGHSFGNGHDYELMLDDGPFSIFVRYFNCGKGDFRIFKKGTFVIRFFEQKGSVHWVCSVTQGGKTYHAWGKPGKIGEWHNYIMTFNPVRKELLSFVDGKVSGRLGIKNIPADSKPKSPLCYSNYGRDKQYIESLIIYDHVLNTKEIKKLSISSDK